MRNKLAVAALVALSVSALAAEVESGEYTAEELNEALAAEIAGQNRSTAIKEVKAALADAMSGDEVEESTAGLFVCAGKTLTTGAGIKVAGDEIKEGMLPEKSVKSLLEKKIPRDSKVNES